MQHSDLRWIKGPEAAIEKLPERSDAIIVRDSRNGYAALFSTSFFVRFYAEKYPELRFVTFGQE